MLSNYKYKDNYKDIIVKQNNELKAKVFKLEVLNNDYVEKNKELMDILLKREKELHNIIDMNRDLINKNRQLLKDNKVLNNEQKKFFKALKKHFLKSMVKTHEQYSL